MVRFLFFVLVCLPVLALGQGKLMLVGGGSEKDEVWGWSNIPYQWAVENATNKRVAIISYAESSDPSWLPDYFVSLGAEAAENFVIEDRMAADNTALYDELISFDLIFFKGGDQSVYYAEYKDTALSRAVETVFEGGGVIAGTSAGMAILTSIIYSAEEGTLYPDQALGGQAPGLTTLRDDMFSFLDGHLGDTHFAERGRLPRLITFLGEAVATYSNQITGIGVDDQTAFCIDENGIGIVYGTGAVTIANLTDYTILTDDIPQARAELTSLVHGYSYDLDGQSLVENYSQLIGTEQLDLSVPGELYLTGSDPFGHNEDLFQTILAEDDRPWIILGPAGNRVQSYLTGLESLGATVTHIQPDMNENPCKTVGIRNILREGAILLFAGNDPATLSAFLKNHPTGLVIEEAIQSGLLKTILIGQNAMLAGSLRVTNNFGDDMNAYFGDLAYDEGIGFIPSSIVLTEAYDPSSTNYYENNTQAGVYGLINNRLGNALFLNERSWVHIYQGESQTLIRSGGDYAAMRLINSGNLGALANQPVNASGNVRNIVGYDAIQLALIGPDAVRAGEAITPEVVISAAELMAPENLTASLDDDRIRLSWEYFGPQEGVFRVERATGEGSFTVLDELSGTSREYIDEDVQNGLEYTYRIRQETGDKTSCYVETTGITLITSVEGTEQGLRIYPNPAASWLIVQSSGSGNYRLIDMAGREWRYGYYQGSAKISLNDIPRGLYILQVKQGKNVEYRKIAVNSGGDSLTQN